MRWIFVLRCKENYQPDAKITKVRTMMTKRCGDDPLKANFLRFWIFKAKIWWKFTKRWRVLVLKSSLLEGKSGSLFFFDSILWVTAVEFGIVSFVLHFLFEIVFRINFSTFFNRRDLSGRPKSDPKRTAKRERNLPRSGTILGKWARSQKNSTPER